MVCRFRGPRKSKWNFRRTLARHRNCGVLPREKKNSTEFARCGKSWILRDFCELEILRSQAASRKSSDRVSRCQNRNVFRGTIILLRDEKGDSDEIKKREGGLAKDRHRTFIASNKIDRIHHQLHHHDRLWCVIFARNLAILRRIVFLGKMSKSGKKKGRVLEAVPRRKC